MEKVKEKIISKRNEFLITTSLQTHGRKLKMHEILNPEKIHNIRRKI